MSTRRPAKRGRAFAWLLVIAFLVVPLVEVFVLVQVGRVIGAWWTILLLIAVSIVGAWLVKREGGRAWRALRIALNTGRMPARELADGALILIGGCLMLTPGFVTDAFGLLLIVPFTRPLFRRLLAAAVARRLLAGAGGIGPLGATDPGSDATRPGHRSDGPVIRGDVVDEDSGS